MNCEFVQREFNVRYYRWALQEFHKEIENDFPFLRQFKGGSFWHVMEMMSEMRYDDRLLFATALVKRFHKDTVDVVGDRISQEETELCNQYLHHAQFPSPEELALEQRIRAGEQGVYAKRSALVRLVKEELKTASMQVFDEGRVDGVLSYTNTIAGWSIITRIHTREKHAQLSYDHAIWSVNKVKPVFWEGRNQIWPVQLKNSISLASWLGISSRTQWSSVVDLDAPSVAKQVPTLCGHFLHAAPRLLIGLSVE